MQPQEINKIQHLVELSPILNPGERLEWISLLGLMNDKQLLELEKILESPPLPKIEPVKPQGSRPTEVPPLTHIMNLPESGTASFPGGQMSPRAFSQKAGKPTRAWNKLKDVLAEKELPPGHKEPQDELELPPPGSKNRDTYNTQHVAPNTQEETDSTQHITRSMPSKPLSGPPVPKPKVITQLDLAEISKKTPVHEHSSYAKASEDRPEDKLFVPGLQDTNVLMNAKFRKPEPVVPASPKAAEALRKRSVPGRHLSKLQDVANLSIADITTDLVATLKKLSAMYGYNELMFAMEKSPLFQSYINTGLAVLSGKYNLDTGQAKEQTLERYLLKEDFEAFVDVLRTMKG